MRLSGAMIRRVSPALVLLAPAACRTFLGRSCHPASCPDEDQGYLFISMQLRMQPPREDGSSIEDVEKSSSATPAVSTTPACGSTC